MLKINVGGQRFQLDTSLLSRETSLLTEIADSLPPGGEASLQRSSDLFALVVDFLGGGQSRLPVDVVLLRDLYVESAFYRLASLRDAIEAQLLRGASDEPSAPELDAPNRSTPLPQSNVLQRQGETLVAAAAAISKSDTVQRALAAAARAPTVASTASQTFPLRPTGLSTADYVGGSWRALYSAPPTPSRNNSTSLGSRPLVSPSKTSHLQLNRAAATTALPDPFGFTSRRWADGAQDPPASLSEEQPSSVENFPAGTLSGSIRALCPEASIQGCASTMERLTSILNTKGAAPTEPESKLQGKGSQNNSADSALDVAKELMERALLLAKFSLTPPPTPSKVSLVLSHWDKSSSTQHALLPPKVSAESKETQWEGALEEVAPVAAGINKEAVKGEMSDSDDKIGSLDAAAGQGDVGSEETVQESVGSLLTALAAIRTASGNSSVALAGLSALSLLAPPSEGTQDSGLGAEIAQESNLEEVGDSNADDLVTDDVEENAPLSFSPLASPSDRVEPSPGTGGTGDVSAMSGETVAEEANEVPFVIHN